MNDAAWQSARIDRLEELLAERDAEIERLRAYADHFVGMEAEGHQLIIEAAAFLDRAAHDLHGTGWVVLADECRVMAEKLRK